MNKERGLYVNALGAKFSELLRKAHADGLDYAQVNSTLDLIGHPLEAQFAEAVEAALDQGFTGDEIGLVFGVSISNLQEEGERHA